MKEISERIKCKSLEGLSSRNISSLCLSYLKRMDRIDDTASTDKLVVVD